MQMRKSYKAPVAKLIDYRYQEQVKATSFTCDKVIYHAVTNANVLDCKQYRQWTEVSTFSLADPCKEESPFQLPF